MNDIDDLLEDDKEFIVSEEVLDCECDKDCEGCSGGCNK